MSRMSNLPKRLSCSPHKKREEKGHCTNFSKQTPKVHDQTRTEKRLQSVTQEKKNVQRQLATAKKQLKNLIQQDGQELTKSQHKAFKRIVSKNSNVVSSFEEDSPARLFWEEQQKAAASKSARQMRWHPAMIRLCIALHAKSPAAYSLLRSSGFIKLPHKNTLYNYTHAFEVAPGYNFQLLEKVCKDIGFNTLPAFKKSVSVIFDEMKIKTGLVYTSKGTLVGFTDLGDLNNELQKFQRASVDMAQPPIASHVLAVMVRGIF